MIGALVVRHLIPRAFDTLNRRDLPAMLNGMTDDVVMELPGPPGIAGRYEGKAAVEAFWRVHFTRYDTLTTRPRRIALTRPYALGLSNTVIAEWTADGTTCMGDPVHIDLMSIWEIRRGKVASAKDYVFDTAPWEVVMRADRERAARVERALAPVA